MQFHGGQQLQQQQQQGFPQQFPQQLNAQQRSMMDDDVDLDGFLDTYLVALQSDLNTNQPSAPNGMPGGLQGMMGAGGLGGNLGMGGSMGGNMGGGLGGNMGGNMGGLGGNLGGLGNNMGGSLGNNMGGLGNNMGGLGGGLPANLSANLPILPNNGMGSNGLQGNQFATNGFGSMLGQGQGSSFQLGGGNLNQGSGLNPGLMNPALLQGLSPAALAGATALLPVGADPSMLNRFAPAGLSAPTTAPPTRGGSGGSGGGRGRRTSSNDAPPTKSHARSKPDSNAYNDDSDGGMSSGGSASSGEQPKSRKKREVAAAGGDDDLSVAEKRHLALQEKNRRAQRRFRERQKAKITDLHKQIEELTGKVGGLQTENAALHSRTSILEKVLDMRNEQIQVMQETKEINQQAEDQQDITPLTLSAVPGQTINLTGKKLKELTPEEIFKLYQAYIKSLSSGMVELNKGAVSPEIITQVEKLTKEVSFLLMRLSVVRPIETRKFIAVSRQYLNTEAEAIDMWRSVVNSINLSEQQKMEVVQWKQLFMQKVEPIVEERKKLNVQIQAHLPQESFHTRNAITYIKTHEAVARLRENLRAEHNVTIEFCAAVFKGVLNSFQMASLLVQAYPAVPDALAVASAIIAEMTERGQTLPAKVANMPQFEGINGLSVCPPLLCPPGSQDANAPTTAAAAAAAAAQAGVFQGAAIGLNPTASPQHPMLMAGNNVGNQQQQGLQQLQQQQGLQGLGQLSSAPMPSLAAGVGGAGAAAMGTMPMGTMPMGGMSMPMNLQGALGAGAGVGTGGLPNAAGAGGGLAGLLASGLWAQPTT